MKTVVILQARMGSTRLPGKVLKEIAGRPMLAHQIRRLREAKSVSEVVVATSNREADSAILELARRSGVGWFRGDENDVLSRYVGAARQYRADVVVRATADCPLIDPGVADLVIRELTEHRSECDYASNVTERTYPRGLDVEAFFIDTLERMDRIAVTPTEREHVTLGPRSSNPSLFLTRSVVDSENNADLRWTVDTPEDFELVSALYEALDIGRSPVPYRTILSYVRAHPELSAINAGVETWTPATPAVVAKSAAKPR